jgi:hypothetical protein
VAKDYYLPPLQTPKAGICLRSGVKGVHVDAIVNMLRQLEPAAAATRASRAG